MKRQHFILILAAAAICVAVYLAFTSSNNSKDTTLDVGVILPLTGPSAYLGEDERKAVTIMASILNKDQDNRITVTFEDSQNQAASTISAFNKLMASNPPSAAIVTHSGVCGPLSEYVASQPSANHPLIVGTVTASTKITLNNNVFLRAYPSGRDEAKAMAEYLWEERMVKRVAIAYQNDDYGIDGKEQLTETLTQLGGEVVIAEAFAKDALDHRSIIAKFAQTTFDCLYIVGNTPAYSLFFKQVFESGMTPILASGSAMDIAKIREQAGSDAIKGVLYSTPFVETAEMNQNPDFKVFKEELTKQGAKPSIITVYPALSLLIANELWKTSSGVGAERRDDIIRELQNSEIDSFVGKIKFDKTRNAILPVFIREVTSLEAAGDKTLR